MKEFFEDFATAIHELKILILIIFNPREWEISKKIVTNRIDDID